MLQPTNLRLSGCFDLFHENMLFNIGSLINSSWTHWIRSTEVPIITGYEQIKICYVIQTSHSLVFRIYMYICLNIYIEVYISIWTQTSEKLKEKKESDFPAFIDLESAYDTVNIKVMRPIVCNGKAWSPYKVSLQENAQSRNIQKGENFVLDGLNIWKPVKNYY